MGRFKLFHYNLIFKILQSYLLGDNIGGNRSIFGFEIIFMYEVLNFLAAYWSI